MQKIAQSGHTGHDMQFGQKKFGQLWKNPFLVTDNLKIQFSQLVNLLQNKHLTFQIYLSLHKWLRTNGKAFKHLGR